MENPQIWVWGGKKIFWSGEGTGKGIRGGEGKNWGKKTEGEKRKGEKRGKKKWIQGESNRRRAYRSGNYRSRAQCFSRRLLRLSSFTVNNSGLLLCTLMRMLSVTYNTHTHTSIMHN